MKKIKHKTPEKELDEKMVEWRNKSLKKIDKMFPEPDEDAITKVTTYTYPGEDCACSQNLKELFGITEEETIDVYLKIIELHNRNTSLTKVVKEWKCSGKKEYGVFLLGMIIGKRDARKEFEKEYILLNADLLGGVLKKAKKEGQD